MKWTKASVLAMQERYLLDHKMGLLTKRQLLSLIHRLDRISSTLNH